MIKSVIPKSVPGLAGFVSDRNQKNQTDRPGFLLHSIGAARLGRTPSLGCFGAFRSFLGLLCNRSEGFAHRLGIQLRHFVEAFEIVFEG